MNEVVAQQGLLLGLMVSKLSVHGCPERPAVPHGQGAVPPSSVPVVRQPSEAATENREERDGGKAVIKCD